MTLKESKNAIKKTLDCWIDHPQLDEALSVFPVRTIRLFQSVIDIPIHHTKKRKMARLCFVAHIDNVYNQMLKRIL